MSTNIAILNPASIEVSAEFEAEYSDDQYINFSQNLRRKLISKVMSDEHALNDPDTRKEIAALVDSVSITAIQNKRIQVKENEAANMRDVAILLAQVNLESDKGSNPFKSDGNGQAPRGLDTRIFESIPITEGELTIGNIQETKEEFLDRMENR